MATLDCNRELKKNGAAIVSRTCARCGLGPCRQEGSPPKEPCPRGPLAKSIDTVQCICKVCGSPVGGVCLIREEYPPTTAPVQPPATMPPLVETTDANDAYPWSKGDTQILLRSFIFEHLSTPQSTLDFKKEIPALQAYVEWIMTGVVGPVSPPSGGKLKVVP